MQFNHPVLDKIALWIGRIVLGMCVLFGGVTLFAVIVASLPDAVPMSAVRTIARGTPEKEVQKILGAPTLCYGGHWTYSKYFGWSQVHIYFQNGRYEGWFNDD